MVPSLSPLEFKKKLAGMVSGRHGVSITQGLVSVNRQAPGAVTGDLWVEVPANLRYDSGLFKSIWQSWPAGRDFFLQHDDRSRPSGGAVFGTIVNTLAIVAGSLVGLGFKGGIPEKYKATIIHALGLAVLLVGLQGAMKTDALLLVIFSMAIGSVIGEGLGIERCLETLGRWIEARTAGAGGHVATGFVTASLIYCVGSMAIVGSLESGLSGNHQTLLAKSVLDGVTAVVFASTFGIGVLFSAVSVLAYQGAITLAATLLKPLLVPVVIHQISSLGGLLIVAIGLNLLEITKMRVGNMLPAMVVPPVYYLILQIPLPW
jgi:uncharacterized protein